MRFAEWLKESPGRATDAARHFQVTPSAISQWAAKGVPVARMKAVRDFTAGAVSLEELVPDADEADTWAVNEERRVRSA